MTILVDSDVLIEVSRGRNTKVISQWRQMGKSNVAVLCSPISVAELWAGARPNEHDVLNNLFGAMSCRPIDEETGRQAGDYLRHYGRSHGLEMADALIAACAVSNNASLWTQNRKHYPMKDLTFFD